MTSTARLRLEIEHAAATLAEAGVGSPRADAEELAAHAAGTSRGRLWVLDDVDDEFCVRYADLVDARSQRIPLHHIVGTAPLGPVTVQVGPGVFIPRYSMVMFHQIPYAQAQRRGAIQQRILDALTTDARALEQVDLEHADRLVDTELRPNI